MRTTSCNDDHGSRELGLYHQAPLARLGVASSGVHVVRVLHLRTRQQAAGWPSTSAVQSTTAGSWPHSMYTWDMAAAAVPWGADAAEAVLILLEAGRTGGKAQLRQACDSLIARYGSCVTLQAAAAAGKQMAAEPLVYVGGPADAQDTSWYASLHAAAARGHVDAAAFLLACGASLEATDLLGKTPLQHASSSGHTDMVQGLLWAGANIGAPGRSGWTALHWASHCRCAEAASLLLASGAAVDSVGSRGYTPLHIASSRDELRVVRMLLDAGASLEARDQGGRTPLLLACQEGQHQVVEELWQRGAQLDARDSLGHTVLHIACYQLFGSVPHMSSVVQQLLQVPEVRALVNTADNAGGTPLSCACHWLNSEVVQLLLEAGADVHVRVWGRTLVHIAMDQEFRDISYTRCLEALLAAGADADALYGAGARGGAGVIGIGRVRLGGTSPLQRAVQLGHSDAAALLATPTNLRRMSQGHTRAPGREHHHHQQQQQGGERLDRAQVIHLLADGVSVLMGHHPGAARGRESALSCVSAVMEVWGAAAGVDLLRQAVECHHVCGRLLLDAVHSRWLAGMPWLHRKWRVTNRLQQLVGQPLQPQQQQQLVLGMGGSATAAAGEQEQQVPGRRCQPTDVCLRLWTEAVAAADGGDWRLFVARLQLLTGLRPGWATYPLYEFAQRQGRGEAGVEGLCAALLVAWWEAKQQQPAAVKAHAREMTSAVVVAVQTCQQHPGAPSSSDEI